ncbi:hypothetical protein MMC31_004162 [Peltigera leucophlebia]|nr:hypothetical protein [Peltigera leucophlebia]
MASPNTPSPKFIVGTLDGQNQEYEGLSANATVRDLKERIFTAEGVALQNQRLIFGPEIMDDSRSLESYDIPDGFVIKLLTVVHPSEPSKAPPPPAANLGDHRILKTVFIRSAANDHTTVMHDVQLGMTVESFRKEHCRKQGTEAEHSRLIFSGKELEDVKNGKGIPDLGRALESVRSCFTDEPGDLGRVVESVRSCFTDEPGSHPSVPHPLSHYIFLGILITLAISALLLGVLRSHQQRALQERTRALQTAEGNVQDSQTEPTYLRNVRQTLAEELKRHRIRSQETETLLEKGSKMLETTIRQFDDLERKQQKMEETRATINDEMRAAFAERDATREECKSALSHVRYLEAQIQEMKMYMASKQRMYEDMQRKYEYVNQRYLGLVNTLRRGFVIKLLTVVHPSEPSKAPPAAANPGDYRILKIVFIRSAGKNNTTAMHDVQLGMTADSFRKEQCRKQGTEAEHSRLIFSGKERNGAPLGVDLIRILADELPLLEECVEIVISLKDYNFGNVSTHVLVLRLIFDLLISVIDRKIRLLKSIGYRVVVI